MANTISTLNMTKDEWLNKRHESIGASDSACILGLNPWKTNVDLYLEKINPVNGIDPNLAMRLGLKLEPVIKDLLSEDKDIRVRDDNKIRVHPKYPYVTANLDGMVVGEKVPIEYKTMAAWDGEISDHYFTQLQHQMYVTDAEYCYFAVLVLGYNKQFIVEKYERNDEFIKKLATELNHFWTQNVLQLSPPDPVELKDARALYKHTIEDKSITADDSTISTLNEFILIQSEVRAHQFRERELKAEIMKTMKDSEYILDEDGNKLVSWKKSRPSVKFDSKTFEQDHPDLHQTYLKEMEGSRRFLVKK